MFDQEFIERFAKALAPRIAELIRPHLQAKITPRYLDLDEAATYMSTTPEAVRGMLRQKHFPARKIGARLRIDIRDIDKTMDENVQFLNFEHTGTCGEGVEDLDWLRD